MRSSRLSRLLRGASTALFATFTALLGHVSAGGAVPGFLGIAVPLLLSSMLSVLLAGRRPSFTRLLLAVTASQFLFHELFVLGTFTPSVGIAMHQHGTPLVLPGGHVTMAAPASGMWLGHLVAAIITAAALHRGEILVRTLSRAARLLSAWFVTLLRSRVSHAPLLPRGRVAPPAADPHRDGTSILIARQQPRRGPPLPVSI